MISFIAPVEDFVFSEKSELTADASVGSDVTLSLKNNQGFANHDYVMVKKQGNEQAHICQINQAVSGNNDIRIDTLKHDLKEGDIVTKVRFNYQRFYGCVTKTGTFVELTDDGSPKGIEIDNPNGTLFEYTGSEGYLYFKVLYYNNQTSEMTDIDDVDAILGGESDRYCSVADIRDEAGFKDNPHISDGLIENFRLRAEGEIKASLYKLYSLPLSTIPDIITGVVKLLAAGWLLYKEYGAEADGTSKDGMSKVKEARSILKGIRNGSVILLDDDEAKLAAAGSTSDLKGWPDNTTKDAEKADAGGATKFRIKDEF